MKRIGLFGGSFNPVHTGHLILAEHARETAGLDTVLFMPARQPPHKPLRPLAPASERLAMLEIAVKNNPHFQISRLELNQSGPSYTLRTVRKLQDSLQQQTQLCLILGADSILDLPGWWESKTLVREVDIIGLKRPGFPLDDLKDLSRYFGDQMTRKIENSLIEAPQLQISATDVRRHIREGRSIRYLVPDEVRDYILANGLYNCP